MIFFPFSLICDDCAASYCSKISNAGRLKLKLFSSSQLLCSGGVRDRQLPQGQTHGGSQRAGQATDGEGAERRPVAHLCEQTGTEIL